ncbi:MAG TPA: OsmC family protein [Anaerolineales bacterium]|jgi:putative redox protein
MEAKVTWSQAMSFTGTAGTGFTLPLGADPSVGGANDGFRPLELMAISLAGCTAFDVISILRKKQQDVTAFNVQVQASQPDTHPHVFTYARILYQITGRAVEETAVTRAIELSALKYCPAQAMLSKAFPMDLVYEIYEDGGGLVKSGQWKPA